MAQLLRCRSDACASASNCRAIRARSDRCALVKYTQRRIFEAAIISRTGKRPTNLIIQAIGGAIGGNAIGATLKNMDLGPLGNTIAGALGGAGGGSILSALIPALSGAAGGFDIGAMAGHLVGGGVTGAIVTAIVGAIVNGMKNKA